MPVLLLESLGLGVAVHVSCMSWFYLVAYRLVTDLGDSWLPVNQAPIDAPGLLFLGYCFAKNLIAKLVAISA